MAPWEPWEPCEPCELKVDEKTIVPLPFPFNGQLVITSMEENTEAQAKVELQDQNGKVIKTLISAYAKVITCT